MKFTFSERISGLKPSAIREILKVTMDPSVISFAAGSPSPETFPVRELDEISEKLIKIPGTLQYGITEGHKPLRDLLKDKLRNEISAYKEFDELLIVSGAQQGIDLTAKCFLNEGDAVLCENPSFVGALNSFKSYNAVLYGVACDEDGMIPEALEEELKRRERVRLIYTIPTFHNPTGRVLSSERRREILRLAEKYDVLILEDDPYRELYYENEPPMPIKSLDEEGRVIYAGSFSKTISPGIRVGFVSAHRDIFSKLAVAKQTQDVHTNLYFQYVIYEYLANYDFYAHLEQVRALYKGKLEKMDSLLKELPGISYKRPAGGLFLWLNLPKGTDGFEFCKKAGEKKAAFVPGSTFMLDEKEPTETIRLNFSLPSLENIEKGIKRLGETL